MEANELMIGDWVQGFLPDTYSQVCGILNECCIAIMGRGAYMEVSIDDICPIPLTPEILGRTDFVNDEEKEIGCRYHKLIPTGYEKNSYTIQVTFYKEPIMGVNILFKCWGWVPPENGGINDIHLCSIKYVHEFQHALRLCGIEKEITI